MDNEESRLNTLHQINEAFIKVVLAWHRKQVAMHDAIAAEKSIIELSKAIADSANADNILEVSTKIYIATREIILNSTNKEGKDKENGSDESASSQLNDEVSVNSDIPRD